MGAVFIVLLALVAILFALYVFSKWNFNYWMKRNVVHLPPTPLFGNYKDYITLKKQAGVVAQEICKQFPNEPYIGTYYGTEPALLVQDPELIKLIMTKDYSYFSGREIVKYIDREPLTRNMFFTYGDKWKVLRQNTSPMFTAAKVKNMFPLIQKCAHAFENMLDYEISLSNVMDARDVMVRFTMDCIGSCGFGVDTNSMAKDVKDNPFRKIGGLVFENSNIRGLAVITRAIWPALFYGLGLSVFPNTITKFFNNLIIGVFKEREFKPSSRQDFVDAILNLKQNDYITCESMLKSKKGEIVSMKVDDELLAAQCVLFFAAGFETSSAATSYTLYELAKNQHAQTRVREEIDEYLRKRDGKMEYDCVTELPYLEACIDEAMRLYPALAMLTREVLEPYVLPSGLKLEKGLRIHLPIYHLHHSEINFPEPEKYRPERFLPENKADIKQYTYMPFGEGQRICVGMRVAKMQMIPGLVTVLKKFRVELAPGTPQQLTLEPRAIVSQSKELLRLKFTPRDQ